MTAPKGVCLVALIFALCAAPRSATTLTNYPSCPALLSFYHASAIKRFAEFVERPFPFFASPVLSAPPETAAAPQADAAPAAPAPEAGVDFSDTNVQVAGVDEPDIVKTDGRRVFVARGRKLVLVRTASDGTRGYVAATLELPTPITELLLENDTLVLIGSAYGALDPDAAPPPSPPGFFAPFAVSARAVPGVSVRSSPPLFFGEPLTVAYRVTVTASALHLRDSVRMHGRYISARAVNGVVRVIASFRPRFTFAYAGAVDRNATAPPAARRAIRATPIGTWLPRFRARSVCAGRAWDAACARVRTGLVVPCARVYRPSEAFSGFALLSVTTLRTRGEFWANGGAGVASAGENVYATATSVYVATTAYENDFSDGARRVGTDFRTSVHKFRLWPGSTQYAGSGAVRGSVLNQFSMHEHRGTFFVATTEGAPWWRARDESKSRITALRPADRALKAVGTVGNLGVGERIYAVRYVGALAYVVTFREVDPLYVVDIANPWRMRVTGELKIPGFSTYLHPLGGGKLLGVGRDATVDGRTTGAKVSLFDVSDVANPKEVTAWTLKGSYSSAGWDHRAFLYWPAESVAVLPINLYSRQRDQDFSGSIVLKIGKDKIEPRGRISHPKCCGEFAFQPSIQRNFVLGRTNLWSLSRDALQVNDIRTLKFKKYIKFPSSENS